LKTTIRHQALRKSITLLGALALVSSALMVGTGATLAAKPDPVASVTGAKCGPLISPDFQYRVTYDVSANKGRWLFVMGELTLADGTTPDTNHSVSTKVDKKRSLQVETVVDGPAQPATMELIFTDRKGNPHGEPHTTHFCP